MQCIKALIALIVLGVLGGLAFIYSGLFNVAADWKDPAPVAWAVHNTFINSVKSHARGIAVPAQFTDAQVRAGFLHYKETCVYCHGGPGKDPGDIGKGLNPEPPYLVDTAKDWQPNEIFWIVKNGVRMTGMPAFAPVWKDDDIWNIVAFVQKLPTLKDEEYARMEQEANAPPPAR
jgi:mono/diheme cytochrome c family protein